jgi:hypothetical protein
MMASADRRLVEPDVVSRDSAIDEFLTVAFYMRDLLKIRSELGDKELTAIAEMIDKLQRADSQWIPLDELRDAVKKMAGAGLSREGEASLRLLVSALIWRGSRVHAERLRKLLPKVPVGFPIDVDLLEPWAKYAAGLSNSGKDANCWAELFSWCSTAKSSQPTESWLKKASGIAAKIERTELTASLTRLFSELGKPRESEGRDRNRFDPKSIADRNGDVLRGLAWSMGELADEELARSLGKVALQMDERIPNVGIRCPKVTNAALFALSRLVSSGEKVGEVALTQLIRLKHKFRGGQLGMVEKAIGRAATTLGISTDELMEMGVPDFGFGLDGRRVMAVGESSCEIVIDSEGPVARWRNAEGTVVKSIPTEAKLPEHSAALKELRATLKDVDQLLSAQRDRLDRLMGTGKIWAWPVFGERYLEHPVVGAVARKVIWVVDGTAAVWVGGKWRDVGGKVVEAGEKAVVGVWHPIGRPVGEVLAWRERLEKLEIVQPFKQAYREVYLLTEAELRTRTYSNRFAGHVIRQHQFHALAALRGWRNKLRLMVDAEYPPATKELPEYGLRAEWWIEGAGDEYGADTNEAGAFLRLTTDQVRFYRTGALQRTAHAGGGGYVAGRDLPDEPLPLEGVPPLAFSEVMRDVDLFVGVASVGNDPNWQDGGAAGRYRDYWHSYSFGDLSATAQTRREVLAKLLPRLGKLAGKWELTDKFLRVQGKLRGYKIHLGSSNILMEPNDQYLCIVPARNVQRPAGLGYVPFEGDERMSVILSKALLLVEDEGITDVTIARQIRS